MVHFRDGRMIDSITYPASPALSDRRYLFTVIPAL